MKMHDESTMNQSGWISVRTGWKKEEGRETYLFKKLFESQCKSYKVPFFLKHAFSKELKSDFAVTAQRARAN